MRCIQNDIKNEIVYIDDDPFKKAEMVQYCMKLYDRIFFIDFGVGVDDISLDECIGKHEHIGCLVFPGVKEGIDWEMFKNKVNENVDEPYSQMGLNFDTEVGKKVDTNIYHVTRTNARAWIMNTKNVLKSLHKNKDYKVSPKMFEKFVQQGVKLYAFTASKLTIAYTHECISSILNAAGVKVN
tara:strand:- start:272 stop:820 length:549 start_codon:yes stop_codon:yes gene_type:complete